MSRTIENHNRHVNAHPIDQGSASLKIMRSWIKKARVFRINTKKWVERHKEADVIALRK